MNYLFELSSNIKDKIKGWAKTVVTEVKSALSLGTDSSAMKNEVGKYIVSDVASGVYENDKEVVKAFKQMYEKLNYQREFDIISEDEYYVKLERLRDRYFKKGTQNWLKYTAEIYEHQQKRLEQEKETLEQEKESIVSAYDDISGYISQKINAVIDKQASFAESLKKQGNLFNKNKVYLSDKTDTYYSMHDMQEDIRRIREYNSLIEEFSERTDSLGIDANIKKGFLKELRSLDLEDAIGFLTSIKNSRDMAVSEYLSAWNERNNVANAFAAKAYEDEFSDSVDSAYEYMKEVLSRAGYEIPDGFFTSGSLSAQKFGDAFVAEIESQMGRIRSVIEGFNDMIMSSSLIIGGNTYNTSNTSYNIQSGEAGDTVEQIQRYETLKRLSGAAYGGYYV